MNRYFSIIRIINAINRKILQSVFIPLHLFGEKRVIIKTWVFQWKKLAIKLKNKINFHMNLWMINHNSNKNSTINHNIWEINSNDGYHDGNKKQKRNTQKNKRVYHGHYMTSRVVSHWHLFSFFYQHIIPYVIYIKCNSTTIQ